MRLGEVCESVSQTFRRQLDKVVLINTSDVLDGTVTNHAYVPNENLRGQFKKSFRLNDILYSEIRPKNRRFAFVNFDASDYVASTKLMVIRANELVVPEFLFQVLKSNIVIDQLQLLAETRSGTFPQITFSELAALDVRIPSIDEQREIAATLRALDDKINNNTKINHHLEQMAQAIFEQSFACRSNIEIPIGKIIDVRDGTHDSPKPVKVGFPLVTSKHLLPYGVDIISPNRISKADYKKINERSKVDTHDILISMIGTIGLISLVIEKNISFAIKNVGLFKTSQKEEWVYFVLCHLKSPAIRQYIDMRLAGSTQKYISLGELRQIPVPKPTDEELQEFNSTIRPIFEEIAVRVEENRHLAEMRDALLPRLMSGELSVVNI